MDKREYINDELEICRRHLKDILNHEDIPMYAEESITCIDYIISKYIKEDGYTEWITDDNALSPEMNEIPIRVLLEFARNETLFEGINGAYKIVACKKNGIDYFQAWPVPKPGKFLAIQDIYSKERKN